MLRSWWRVLLRKFMSGTSKHKRSRPLSSAQLRRMNFIPFMTVSLSNEIHITQICYPTFTAKDSISLIWEIPQKLLTRVQLSTLLSNWQISITTRSRETLLLQSAKIAPLGFGIWEKLTKVFACMNTIAQTWCFNQLLVTLLQVEHLVMFIWTTKTHSTNNINATGSTRSNTTNPTTSSFWAVIPPLLWTFTSSLPFLRLQALRCPLPRCLVKTKSSNYLSSTTSKLISPPPRMMRVWSKGTSWKTRSLTSIGVLVMLGHLLE